MTTLASTPAPVKADAFAPCVLHVAGSAWRLNIKIDSVGNSWRLTRPGNSTVMVYRIGSPQWGRPRRTRCTCSEALLARGADDDQSSDFCDHIAALEAANLLGVLDMQAGYPSPAAAAVLVGSAHPLPPIVGGAPEPLGPTAADWHDYAMHRRIEDLADALRRALEPSDPYHD